MATTLAFDVYGTLIDTQGVLARLREIVGSRAEAVSNAWREKQLEYSFRRGLMQNYAPFAVCTRDALDFVDARFQLSLQPEQKQSLLASYRQLPAFGDARDGLAVLQRAGHRLFAFSNGTADAVEELLVAAGIRDFFRGMVSTDEIHSFKPNPAVYAHFLRRSGATEADPERAWLVSSNPFDVIGAISAGLRGAWVRRSPEAVFDPWGIEPTVTVESLQDLAAVIESV